MPTALKVELHDLGPALWPGYIGPEQLAEIHESLGTPIFETMYQARRGGLAGTIIRDEWFRYYSLIEPPGTCFAAVDPAISLKTTADETAIVVGNVAIDPPSPQAWEAFQAGYAAPPIVHGTVYVRWVWHGRVGVRETEDVIAAAWDYYRPTAVGIEAVAYQTALVQLLTQDHPELPIEPVTPDRDKLSRHLALARLYEFGRVYHHPDLKGSSFEYQLTHLPAVKGKHDDMADAAAYLLQMSGLLGGAIAVNTRPPGFL